VTGLETALVVAAGWIVLAIAAWAMVLPLLRAASGGEALSRRLAAAREARRRRR
jgi:hypothetical protein